MTAKNADKPNISKPKIAMERATAIAAEKNHEYVTREHLLLSCMEIESFCTLLKTLGVNYEKIQQTLESYVNENIPSLAGEQPVQPKTTMDLKKLVERFTTNSLYKEKKEFQDVDILKSFLEYDPENCYASYLLLSEGLNEEKIGLIEQKIEKENLKKDDPNRKKKAAEYLERFAVNLSVQAREGKISKVVGRNSEVAEIVRTINRKTKNNVILVGDPGVGKTAIAEALAVRIHEGNVPKFQNHEVWSVDVGSIIAGTRYRGDLEERVGNIVMALEVIGNTIVFIDEIHMLITGGGGDKGSGSDIANLLKNGLSKGLKCIGSTTHEEYRKHFEKERALARRFAKITVNEPSIDEAVEILTGVKQSFEEHHGVTITDEAVRQAVVLSSRYIRDRMLPDKAIDIIDLAASRQSIEGNDEPVDVSNIQHEISVLTNIPIKALTQENRSKLKDLESTLKSSIFGQDRAVEEIVNGVLVANSKLQSPDRPEAVYLLVGPTGTGKTEIAKQLARCLDMHFIRYDMSEYVEKHRVSQFIGSPSGYVGYNDGGSGNGLLINDIEKHPKCVLLFDEIEKADPAIYNLLLQVMDEGKLTSSTGKVVSFRNAIILMTSNAGATAYDQNSIGFQKSTAVNTNREDDIINKKFTPEFRNRFDAIIKFNKLSEANIVNIVDKFLNEINVLAQEQNVEINVSPAAKNWLAKKGYDPKMGARPLKRLIQHQIKVPLSRELLFGENNQGSVVKFDVVEDNVIIVK